MTKAIFWCLTCSSFNKPCVVAHRCRTTRLAPRFKRVRWTEGISMPPQFYKQCLQGVEQAITLPRPRSSSFPWLSWSSLFITLPLNDKLKPVLMPTTITAGSISWTMLISMILCSDIRNHDHGSTNRHGMRRPPFYRRAAKDEASEFYRDEFPEPAQWTVKRITQFKEQAEWHNNVPALQRNLRMLFLSCVQSTTSPKKRSTSPSGVPFATNYLETFHTCFFQRLMPIDLWHGGADHDCEWRPIGQSTIFPVTTSPGAIGHDRPTAV